MRSNVKGFSTRSLLHALLAFSVSFINPSLNAQAQLQIDQVGRDLDRFSRSLITSIEDPLLNTEFPMLRSHVLSALNATPQVLKRLEDLELQRARRAESLAALLPRVQTTVSGGRREVGDSPSASSDDQTLSVSQLVFDFNASLNNLRASERRTESEEMSYQFARSEVLLDLVTAVIDLRRARQKLELTQANLESRKQFLDLVRQKEALGASSQADIVRAEAKVFEAADQLPSALRRVNEAKMRYTELFDKEPSDTPEFRLPAFDASRLPSSQDLVDQLRTVKEGELNLEAADLEHRAEKAKLWGGITLEGSVSRSNTEFTSRSEDTSIQLVYRLDIFSGFAQSARIEQASARKKNAQWELVRIRREMIKTLENTRFVYDSQRASVNSRVSVLRSAQAASIMTKDLFAYNRGGLTDVFSSQEEYLSAASNLVDSYADMKIAYYQMLHQFDKLTEVFEPSL
jgi:adhesin transport system outer membrane protein